MKIPLSLVYEPPERSRDVQPDVVAALAKSMAHIGLRTPITVIRAQRIRDGRPTDAWEIKAGLHRVEAARSLGWTEIDAEIDESADPDLWTIAENLHRADLTPAERGRLIKEWMERTGERQSAETRPIESKRSDGRGHRSESGVNKAARELGIPRSTVQDALRAAAQAGAPLAPPPVNRPVSPAPAPLNDIETEEQWLATIMRAWNRGAPQWRERFLEMIDRPIADTMRATA